MSSKASGAALKWKYFYSIQRQCKCCHVLTRGISNDRSQRANDSIFFQNDQANPIAKLGHCQYRGIGYHGSPKQ